MWGHIYRPGVGLLECSQWPSKVPPPPPPPPGLFLAKRLIGTYLPLLTFFFVSSQGLYAEPSILKERKKTEEGADWYSLISLGYPDERFPFIIKTGLGSEAE